ncbi:adenosylcobinamide-GDP ribazoletransferase [Motilimonas pumila]|uniref:Adenosylcobinamide-GDP ribazoletransferase n=1 Tax=Motilimonas pumila TaxID=2303987 RepID=A0A418YBA3_9GAMM|nr:adenosylcobinamide-GDP ribazoletransferase [Motilimonas pumila]RJG40259.1 adenosylcobinamide-GDP ribazoletransferase [Motilimonas pumila]
MAKVWPRFIHALTFYTRIPGPKSVQYDPETLTRGNVFFPLIGYLVAAFAALVLYVSGMLFSLPIAVLLSMAATIWLTGSFHEDGFADTCDGFGGGYGKKAILTIMKDSRVGTYASVGLTILLLLKFQSLSDSAEPILALFVGHTVSRFFPLLSMSLLPYVREHTDSKSAQHKLSLSLPELMFAAIWPLLALAFLPWQSILVLIACLSLMCILLNRWFKKQLGGITGDCLGASQQIYEVTVYLLLGSTLCAVT